MFSSSTKPEQASRCSACGGPLRNGHCPRCLLQLGLMLEPPHLEALSEEAATGHQELIDENLDQTIDRFHLLRRIGEGGFSVVYLAEQKKPVRRMVALKITKLGMDTQQVIGRFEVERQALALMNHPHIAQVFDAGATANGRPYFAMEFVPGAKITEVAREANLSIRERLELFIGVCSAVQHAHQKGIIHRDLKPSNILVTEHEGVRVPKVIDFGIAKAIHGRLSSNTLYTAFEQFMGTPAYMSPEQVELRNADVDTRTDIYSLGVLLYELLTGTTPFTPSELFDHGFDEMRRTILFKQPPPPSARLGSARTFRPANEPLGRFEPARAQKAALQLLKRDLDWIVMKCLEKDRTRRYETANDLSQDIQRYLHQEPVVARPPSRIYYFGKLVHRNRTAFGVAAVLVLALLVEVVVSTLEAVRARQAEARADKAFVLATAESKRAHQARARALEESDQAKRAQRRADVAATQALQNLYAAKMSVAQLAWEQNKGNRVRQILEETAADPQRSFEWFYWQQQVHLERLTLRGHLGAAETVCFSPDGQSVITASGDRTAIVWDAKTGDQLRVLRGHASRLWSARISPDGRRIVTASGDQTARVWDALTGKQLLILAGHTDELRWAEFSPDGTRIVTCSADGTSKLWDALTGRELLTYVGHTSRVWAAAFSPNGTRLVTPSADGTARVWDTETGEELVCFKNHSDGLRTLAIAPDGEYVVTGGWDQQIKLWELATGREVRSFHGHTAPIWSLAFAPDGRTIISGSADQTARIWERETGRELRLLRGHAAAVTGVAVASSGEIATAGDDFVVKLWSTLDPSAQSTVRSHSDGVASLAFSPGGDVLLTGGPDSTVRSWDVLTAAEQYSAGNDNTAIWSVAFSPSGLSIATGAEDGTINVRDAKDGIEQFALCGHGGLVDSIAFSPDSTWLFSGSADGTARIWDLPSRRERARLAGHTGRIWGVAVSPDGRYVATAGEDHTVKVWSAETGCELCTLRGHLNRVRAVAFSPDGRQLASASGDWTAKLWDLTSRQCTLTFRGHSDGVAAIAFSRDGRRLLTGSEDHTAKLWDLASGQELLTLHGHGARIRTVAFSPDGLCIATGSDDHLAKLWRAATPAQVRLWAEQEHAAQEWLAAHVDHKAPDAAKPSPPIDRISDWLLLAPLPYASPSGALALDETMLLNEALLRPKAGETVPWLNGPTVRWRSLHTASGIIDVNQCLGTAEPMKVAFAVAYIRSAIAQHDVQIRVGSDDEAKLYLNGKAIYRRAKARTYLEDQDVVAGLDLKAGVNVLVLKLVKESGGWKASVRLTPGGGS